MQRKLLFAFCLGLLLAGLPGTVFAQSATLYFVPATGNFTVGQTISVNVMVDTQGEAVNAVGAYFTYSESTLEALGVDTAGSVMTLFAEQNARGGRVEISGGTPTPGFSGIQKIAAVNFRVKSTGSGALAFTSDSAVLRDSDNQNILNLGLSGNGTYTLQASTAPPAVPPPAPTPTPGPSAPPPPTPSPTPPSSPPAQDTGISAIRIEQVGEGQALIRWRTSNPADSRVTYGESIPLAFTVLDAELVTEHEVLIEGFGSFENLQIELASREQSGVLVQTETLLAADVGTEEEEGSTPQPSPQAPREQSPQDASLESGGIGGIPPLVLFVILPIAVLLIIVLIFLRRRAKK